MIYPMVMQDDSGNILYPHTTAAKTWLADNFSVKDAIGLKTDFPVYIEESEIDINSIINGITADTKMYENAGLAKAIAILLKKHQNDETLHHDTTYGEATESAAGLMSTEMVTKLAGIEAGANKYVLGKATASELGGVMIGSHITVADGVISITNDNITGALGYIPIDAAKLGVASGIAQLDENGHVLTSQLPGFVDDVLEGYLYNGKFYVSQVTDDTTAESTPEITGESGKLYVDLNTEKIYRWTGSIFAEISASLVLGTSASTAFRGDYGNTAYVHSQITSGNPHNVTAADVGLDKVNNTADSEKRVLYSESTGAVDWANVNNKPESYYTLPEASTTLGGVKTTSDVTSTEGLIATPIIGGVPYYHDTTYGLVNETTPGLMSAEEHTKLAKVDGSVTIIAAGSSVPVSQRNAGSLYIQLYAE